MDINIANQCQTNYQIYDDDWWVMYLAFKFNFQKKESIV